MSTLDWRKVLTALLCFACGIFLQGTAAPLHYLHFMRSHSHLLFYLSWNTPEYTMVHDNILLELRGFLLFSLHRSRESQTAAISLKCSYIYSALYEFWSLWLHPQSVFWYVFDLEERSRGERCMLIPFTVIAKLCVNADVIVNGYETEQERTNHRSRCLLHIHDGLPCDCS